MSTKIIDLTTAAFHAAELYLALKLAAGHMHRDHVASQILEWIQQGVALKASA